MTQSIPHPVFAAAAEELPLGDIRAGSLQVTLAVNQQQLEDALGLRYRIWVEEVGAEVAPEMHKVRREWDRFDQYCDHLLVIEHVGPRPRVVGTYRFLRREGAKKAGSFYSAGEFDISAIERYPGEVMELGRTSVDPEYRNRAVMQLLLRGIGAYVGKYDVQIMFGCASFQGVDPQEHAARLSYLHHYHMAPPELLMKALPDRYTRMDLMPKDAIDVKRTFVSLPALIKAYMRTGGYIGDGAVIDREYNTVDVGIVVKTELVTDKYYERYGQKEDV